VDRGKRGCKRHLLTDAGGVPLAVRTTPANVNDERELPALLDGVPAVQGPRGRPRRKPGSIFGDRAYGTAEMIALVLLLGIFSFLAPRARKTHGSGLGAFRYVVERSLACFSHFRRIRMCYERWGEHFQALHDLAACCLIATRLRSYELRF
jgi:transposase